MIDLSKGYVEFSDASNYQADSPIWVNTNAEQKITCYEELMAMALIMRAHQRDPSITVENQEKIFPHIKRVLDWLRAGDFYTSPASTKYHDSYTGGLLNHTLQTYLQLLGLRSVPKFKTVVDEQWWSAVFAVLVHDWCKIGRYESYWKNVRDERADKWTQIMAYRYREDGVARFGHGTQSLVMAMQLCVSKYTSLSFEEMASIRWHMDNWDMGTYDAEDMRVCDEKIPMVRMVQFADQLAITTY